MNLQNFYPPSEQVIHSLGRIPSQACFFVSLNCSLGLLKVKEELLAVTCMKVSVKLSYGLGHEWVG